jgi:carbon-monoxide dehydrogenase medium subunit
MRPSPFAYCAPETIPEVVEELRDPYRDARILAGGQSLIPMLNLRIARFDRLIDIGRVDGLTGIRCEQDSAVIGAATTHAEIERSPELAERLPILREAASHIGHHAIRNRGTFGGSISHADPSAEWPTIVTALGASLRVVGSGGERRVDARGFFRGHFTTALEPDELLVDLTVPLPVPGTGWSFMEFARQSGAFALALVAVLVRLDERGAIGDACVAVGGCGSQPMLPDPAPLFGLRPTDSARAATHVLGAELSPVGDIHADAADRRRIAEVLIERALARAMSRARRPE